ncbi:MAG: universal stress protein [Deltaproteobacteria bacterium]|nr:universal stress protein [Deltaproteobacteria bacterium]
MEVKLEVKNILVPIDFSDTSRKAFYIALKFAKLFDAKTYVLHVQEPLGPFDSAESMEKHSDELSRVIDGVKRRVNELFDEGGLAEVDRRKVHIEIRGGKPYMEILKFAVHEKMDLIVMGSHGYTGVKHMLIGSQTEKVMRRAPCLVMCVKPDDFEIGSDITGVPKKFKSK